MFVNPKRVIRTILIVLYHPKEVYFAVLTGSAVFCLLNKYMDMKGGFKLSYYLRLG